MTTPDEEKRKIASKIEGVINSLHLYVQRNNPTVFDLRDIKSMVRNHFDDRDLEDFMRLWDTIWRS